MASTGLVVAGAALALLAVSVGADLAFQSHIRVEASGGGEPMRLVGQGALDGRYADRSLAPPDPFRANASDMMTIRITLENGNPWSTSRSFDLAFDGCHEGARKLVTVDIDAPARGAASATTEIEVSTLLHGQGRYMPEPGTVTGPTFVHLQVCRGSQYVASATIPIEEVTRR